VVAHTTMPFRTSVPKMIVELAAARGNFNRITDRTARRDAGRMTAEDLLGELRANVEHPWAPPGGGPVGALSHDVIHGLDITVGLGLGRQVPPERLTMILSGMRPRHTSFR
jgi:hypothetical protein